MPNAAQLKQAPSHPESRLPQGVQKFPRPPAAGRAVSLAFLRWEKVRLDRTEGFWRDFGFTIVSSSDMRILARGTGEAPCIAIATTGERDRFVGPAFTMSEDSNLDVYVRDFGGRLLSEADIPGGGRGVEILDPSGRSVWLLQGQQPLAQIDVRDPLTPMTNTAHQRRRINETVRPPIEPATVVRIGHFVLQTVDFMGMADWYLRVLGLIPTDVQYLADGSPALAFCRLNLGECPAEHHTVVLVSGIEDKYEHSAYEVVDLDAIGQGQQVLRAQGWRHMWGIGRHVLGSQLFDYWFDPDGFEYEHYTDGDMFTSDFETCYSPLEFGGIWAWGDDPPASMKPAKSLGTLFRVLRLIASKRIAPQRLKLLAKAAELPARPWS